jgi:hypothetical protein
MLMDEQDTEQIYKCGFCIMLSCMYVNDASNANDVYRFLAKTSDCRGEVFRKEHDSVPNSRAAPAERLAFNISVMFTRRSGCLIVIYEKNKAQY